MSSADKDYRRLPKSNSFWEVSFSTLLLNAQKGSTDVLNQPWLPNKILNFPMYNG